jgi:hypothetical protein
LRTIVTATTNGCRLVWMIGLGDSDRVGLD